MKQIIFAIVLIGLFAAPALAQGNVNFAWDPHPQADQLQGFWLYQAKQSPVCPGGIPPDRLLATTKAYQIDGGLLVAATVQVDELGRLYWALTAITPDGTESDCSNEVTDVIKPKPPKMNTVQQIAAVVAYPAKTIGKAVGGLMAGLFGQDENLRIIK